MTVRWYDLIKAERSKTAIIHEVGQGPEVVVNRWQSVRAGVSFPDAGTPGAFVVIGLDVEEPFDTGPDPLVLIDEGLHEGVGIDSFWQEVTDAVTATLVRPLYLDMTDQPQMLAFYDFIGRRNLSIDFEPAPWPDRFQLGLGGVFDWFKDGRLDLHKDSKTRSELRGIEQAAVSGDHPERRFPLTNALRFVLSGFRKFPPVAPLKIGRGAPYREGGWML